MRRPDRRFRLAAVVALAALLLSACVTRQDGAGAQQAPAAVPIGELGDVTLQIGDQKGGTQALMTAADALAGAPYRVEWSTSTSGPPQVEAATAGKIDFAVTGNTPPLFGAAANARIKVVAVYDGGGEGDRILVPADSPIRSVGDLRGRSVAVGKGSSAHGNVLAQLERAGVGVDEVELVFLQPADALGAFTRGQTDAWAIWDPYTAQAEADLDVRSIAQATGVTNGAGFGIASDETLADPRRNSALEDFVVRLGRASQWAQANPDAWAQSYARSVGLPLPVAVASQRRSLRQPVPLDTFTDSEQKLLELFAETGQVASAPRFSDWLDDRYEAALAPVFAEGRGHRS